LVLPIEYSYAELWEVINDIDNIYQNEGCFHYENNNWTQFVKYMLKKIEKRTCSFIREKQVHYGYSGNSRVEGMRLHTVLTKEESIITNRKVRHGVKLLRLL
jgi:23S rRNA maturation-related 3'-5' exoribonuclease YhaM